MVFVFGFKFINLRIKSLSDDSDNSTYFQRPRRKFYIKKIKSMKLFKFIGKLCYRNKISYGKLLNMRTVLYYIMLNWRWIPISRVDSLNFWNCSMHRFSIIKIRETQISYRIPWEVTNVHVNAPWMPKWRYELSLSLSKKFV